MSADKIHIIPNAHLDPVWLWSWRDGYSEVHNTIQSAVDRMRENPDMTFVRSSAVVYKWLEESNPELFSEVRALVDEGRWEIVGGWLVQSDTIISSGESLIRQGMLGREYFQEKFGKKPEISYLVDSFGQNAGLPKILSACGFKYHLFMRPNQHEREMPNLFWWEGSDGSRILTQRIPIHTYNTPIRLTKENFAEMLKKSTEEGYREELFFFGVGNHGGGPTKQQIEWLKELKSDFNWEFSTLENYFKTVENDDLPVIKGEFTHHAPGCYSAKTEVKQSIDRCGMELFAAEATKTAIPEAETATEKQDLNSAWWNYLYNHFHDIYPGSSIASVYDREVRDSLGHATHVADQVKVKNLHAISKKIDTSSIKEGGVFVFNPLPWRRKVALEFDAFVDPNLTGDILSLKDSEGDLVPVQWNQAESNFGPCDYKWARLTAEFDLPALGYQVYSFEKEPAAILPETKPANLGKWLDRLSLIVMEDEHDLWGHGARDLGSEIITLKFTNSEILEEGPVRHRLRGVCKYKNSRIVVDLSKYAEMENIQVDFTIDWHEPRKVLKLGVDTALKDGKIASAQAYDIIERTPDDCEQAMGEWMAAVNENGVFGIVTRGIRSYDSKNSEVLRPTLCRSAYHADHGRTLHGDEPMMDLGRIYQRLWLIEMTDRNDYRDWLPRMAMNLRTPPEHVVESNHSGYMPWSNEGLRMRPDALTVGAIKPFENGFDFRFINNSEKPEEAEITWTISGLEWNGAVKANSINTLRFENGKAFLLESL